MNDSFGTNISFGAFLILGDGWMKMRERIWIAASSLYVSQLCICTGASFLHLQILAIQGYVGVFTMGLPAPPTNGTPAVATLALVSRLGWKRAGTRFNTRGVDDDGNTANFVEVRIRRLSLFIRNRNLTKLL
jgi:hypothetical protein